MLSSEMKLTRRMPVSKETTTTNDDPTRGKLSNGSEARIMRMAGVGLNSMSYVAPRLAGRLAAYLWFTPFPFSRSRQTEIPFGAGRVTFESGGMVVHGYEIGSGPRTALLIHGWAGSSRQYRRIALRLADDGYKCFVIDLPAHGVESGESTDVPEIAEAIEIAGNAIGRLDLVVAHSFGAMATSIAMQSSLRADRLVLLAPALRPHKVLESFAANLQLRPIVVKALEQTMEARFGEDIWKRIPNDTLNMDVPDRTLIIHDLDDDMMPIEEARLLSEGWDLELNTTQGHGHNGMLRASEVIDQIATLAAAEPASA